MTPEICRKLLDNGVLEAYAQGKKIEYLGLEGRNWSPGDEWSFDGNHEHYRIKPSPTPKRGMYLHQGNEYRRITSVSASKVYATLEGLKDSICVKGETFFRRILTPFTFEQAVKAVAENEFTLNKGVEFYTIIALHKTEADITTCRKGTYALDYQSLIDFVFPKDIPFANVTYEEVTE
jgi:hypothetical protein